MKTPELNLRRAGPADAAAIKLLAERAYAKWVPVLGRPPAPMSADYAVMLEDHRIDLHEVDGALAGSIATRLADGFLFIESLAVDPDWQGRGLGRALLGHAEELAREAGKAEIQLLTNAKMAANVTYYQGLGYDVFEREEHPNFGMIIHLLKRL